CFWPHISPRQVRRQLPEVILTMAPQQRVDLILQVADGERIGRWVVLERNGYFQLLDFGFLRRAQVTPSQFVAGILDAMKDFTQLTGSTLGRRGRVVELMGESGRKLAQARQAIALLLEASCLANSVRHQSHETGDQFRHFLNELWELRGRKAQDSAVRKCPSIHRELFHPGKRQHTSNVAGFGRKHNRLTAEFAPDLKLSFEQHEHGVRRITLTEVNLARFERQLRSLAEKPLDLIVGQISEYRD